MKKAKRKSHEKGLALLVCGSLIKKQKKMGGWGNVIKLRKEPSSEMDLALFFAKKVKKVLNYF